MAISYAMRGDFADVLRAAIALQVATLELHEENVADNIALDGFDKCLVTLNAAAKLLRKNVK